MKTLDVSVVVLMEGGRVLVNRRPPGSYFEGWWEWPGGKREPGETAEACARRELHEELGLQAGPLRLLEELVAEYPDRRIRLSFFLGRRAPKSEPSPDAVEHQWLPLEDLKRIRFLEPNLPVVEKLLALEAAGCLY